MKYLFTLLFVLSALFMMYASGQEKGQGLLTIKVNGIILHYPVFGLYLLPDQEIDIEVISGHKSIIVTGTRGTISQTGPSKWNASNDVSHPMSMLKVCDTLTTDCIILNLFTKVHYSKMIDGAINNYRIGEYPAVPWKGNPKYGKPDGFVEVTEDNKNILISPHFTLGQFLCKQVGNFPKYILIREELLLKLEYLLKEVNASGYKSSTFHIMSGYRTPFYNKAIGNVKYSRHVFGDAADIFIDENGDGKMDDLNRDGVIDFKDVEILYNIVDEASKKDSYKPFFGGLGKYKKTGKHWGFVHVDTRGHRARW